MDYSKAALVVCVTLFLVVGINAWIYVSISRRNTVGQIELLRRAVGRARNPWEPENEELHELSRLVESLKKPSTDQNHTETEPDEEA